MGARDIVSNLITHDKASKTFDTVGKAAKKTARDYDDLSAAEQRLALEAEKAGVAVEKAARAAARAEERFGRDSEQVREATRRLRAAKLDLADADEKVKRKADEAAAANGNLRTKLQALVPTLARNATGFSLLTAGTRGLGGALTQALPVVARIGSWVGAFGSAALTAAPIIGAFAAKVAGAAVEFGHLALAVAPAAASLPGLAAGFFFAKATITTASIGIAKGLDPIMARLPKLSAHLQNIAGRGVPALAKQFLKVNFPTVADAMNRIAKSTNSVVLAVGKWANSLNGQVAIRAVVEGTAQAMKDLAPHVTRLAISLGNLIGRAGPIAFEQLSTGLSKAADAASRFVDSISKSDVRQAWTRIDGFGGAVGGVVPRLRALGSLVAGGVRWWRAHADAIQHVRDVIALVTIAVGVATGGWIPALIAGVSLLISHWDQVTAALGRVKAWFNGTSDSANGVRTVVEFLRQSVADLAGWFQGQLLPALERGARAVMPAIHDAIHMVTQTFNENRDVIGKVRGVLTALGIVITEAIIPAITFLAQTAIQGLGVEFSAVIWIVNKIVIPGIKLMAQIVLGVLGAIVNGAADAFGWIPGLGPKLKEAAAKFNKFADAVNGALSGIQDQKVTVGATIYYNDSAGRVGFKGSQAIARARGGHVTGPGGPRDDRVPAMLSNGEYVVNAAATSRHRDVLEAINSGRGYARGGLVVSAQTGGLDTTMAAERKALLAAAKRMAPSISAPGGHVGAGVRQWAGLVAQVLAELGQPGSALGPVLSRMQRESGGNPHAINLWDSNARAGDPSRGLMQTIGCVTVDTVILTRRGWLKHDEVQVGDETVGYNPETGRSEWTPVLAVLHYDDAEVWRIGNKHWRTDVTPNHRWWSDTAVKRRPETLAECPECGWTGRTDRGGRNVTPTPRSISTHLGRAHQLKAGERSTEYVGEFVRTDELGHGHRLRLSAAADTGTELDITDHEAALIAWAQGDGTISPDGDITLWQSKPEGVAAIRALLARMGIRHGESSRQRAPHHHRAYAFRIRRAVARDLLRRARLAELGPERFVLALSLTQRAAWLAAMIAAEGHTADNHTRIAQINGPMQDAIKLAVYLCGYRPTFTANSAERNGHQPAGVVGMARAHVTPSMFDEPEVLPRQTVWCVTTELGTWTAETNGLAYLTGNSTFAAFAGPYRGAGIWDPHANVYAGVNYAIHRYGAGWIARMTAGGGYDRGGVARHAGLIPKLTNRPERVLSPAQTVSFDRLTRVLAQGGAGNVHVTVEVTASAAVIEDRVVEGVRSAVNHGRLAKAVIPPGSR